MRVTSETIARVQPYVVKLIKCRKQPQARQWLQQEYGVTKLADIADDPRKVDAFIAWAQQELTQL